MDDAELGDNMLADKEAIVVPDTMRNAEMALLVMRVLMMGSSVRLFRRREVMLYNVVMKVMKKGKDIEGAERLFEEMIGKGLAPDNVLFCTLISCARSRGCWRSVLSGSRGWRSPCVSPMMLRIRL